MRNSRYLRAALFRRTLRRAILNKANALPPVSLLDPTKNCSLSLTLEFLNGLLANASLTFMNACVFIHTNRRQLLGALVSAYSLRRNSSCNENFEVRIIRVDDHPFFAAREGQRYLRGGSKRTWTNDDLQSFTPLRFMPPELMAYEGRAVVIDPDVFAVGDIYELLRRDMGGKAVLCRRRPAPKNFATSVMLLDCAKLRHWRCEEQFGEMFRLERDYLDWVSLALERPESIGALEPEWNDFDQLTERTKLLHNTRRSTQPWKTGLPVDYRPPEKFRFFPPRGWLKRARRQLFGEYAFLGRYRRHPDPNQEQFFFGLLRECLEQGHVTDQFLRDEMQRNHVRPDAFELALGATS